MTSHPPHAKQPGDLPHRGLWIAAVVILGVLALVGVVVLGAMMLSDRDTSTAAATSPPPVAPVGVGTPIEFDRADNGTTIGTVTFSEIVALPADCLDEPQPGTQAVAVRVEINNSSAVAVEPPTDAELTTLDAAGITQAIVDGSLANACASTYPRGADAAGGRKTVHWRVFQIQPEPVALQFVPIVEAENATIEDLENAWVKVAPASVNVTLPTPLPSATAPITTEAAPTTGTPAPPTRTTQAKAAPAAGVACDPSVDNWGFDASGGQLKCAYAGGPRPRWVNSAPLIGTRQPGSPCSYDDGVAESPSGQTLVCTGDRDSAVWTPGP